MKTNIYITVNGEMETFSFDGFITHEEAVEQFSIGGYKPDDGRVLLVYNKIK